MRTRNYPLLTNWTARGSLEYIYIITTGNFAAKSREQPYMKTTNTAEEHRRFQAADTSLICKQPMLWTYSGLN